MNDTELIPILSPNRSGGSFEPSVTNSGIQNVESGDLRLSYPFPFSPAPIPPPPEFPGCFCDIDCTCRYESLKYISPEGLFLPFAPPPPVQPPRVCVWMHLSRDDIRRLEDANFSRQASYSTFEKRFPVPEDQKKDMLWELLYEALRYCRVNAFNPKQTSSLVSIYYITHMYYISSLWRLPDHTYAYFKECILLHTVQRPPKSAEIMEPMQSYHALKHFINTYLRQLPLVDIACLPQLRLQLIWPIMASTASSSGKGEEEGDEGGEGLRDTKFEHVPTIVVDTDANASDLNQEATGKTRNRPSRGKRSL